MDWGQHDSTGASWLHVLEGGRVLASREHIRNGWDVGRHADVIKMNSRGRDVKAYCLDQSAFRKDPTSQISVADLFRKHGVSCQRSEKNLNGGIDIVKRFLRGDENGPWLIISSSCRETISALKDWEWNTHEPDILAAMRYGLTHIVKLRMTRLAEVVPVHAERVDISKDVLLGLKSPLNRGPSEWSWDSALGVPS